MDRYQFFARLPRHEPGGVTFSSSYLSALPMRSSDRVCEIGCGSGENAVWVARSRGCRLVAVDRDRRYLKRCLSRAEEGGGLPQLTVVQADYTNLPFADGAFSVLYSEGTTTQIGLKTALTAWRRVIRPDGHMAITHPGVLRRDAPSEVRGPLERRMSEPLGTLDEYKAVVKAAGYEIVHNAPLQADTWDQFYTVALRHAWALLDNGDVPEDDPVVNAVIHEANWYRRIGRGRVFYQGLVLRRTR